MSLNDQYQVEEPQLTPEIDYQELERPVPSVDFSFLIEKLKTPTGNGSIEDYQTHIFNPSKSRGIAQILRGMTGFIGEMHFAILDIFLGFVNLKKERTQTNDNVASYRKNFVGGIGDSSNL